VAERFTAPPIRSFQDDKAGGCALADRLTALPIRFLPAVERTRREGKIESVATDYEIIMTK
jgi:hypothetical protein